MTSQRPASPTAGDLFFNLQKKAFEVWTGSAWVSVAVNGAVPDAPTLGTVTLSALTASIPFTGPTDYGDASITTYTITSNPGSISASGSSSPISISGLSQSTAYTFTGTATNAYGVSLSSSSSNSVTTASVPGAPTSVVVSDPGTAGSAYVEWSAPSSNGGSSITDYVIEYSSNSGSSWSTFSDGTSTNTYATVTGLTMNTAYIFKVSASNIIGTGTASTASSPYTSIEKGAYESIATVTVGAGGSSTITFSSIPSTYSHLQIRALYQSSSNAVIRFNSDSTYTNYRSHYLEGDGANISSGTVQNSSYTGGLALTGIANTASTFGAAIIDILDYANNNKYKTVKSLNGIDKNGSGYLDFDSSLWMNNSTVSSITLAGLGLAFSEYSSFALYGIKGVA
jgi:hypothetical protein